MKKATSRQTRAHNRRLILNRIYHQGDISRADIARATSLTRTTVSQIVNNLIDDGLIKEIGHGPSEGGKPPMLLSLIDDSRHVIGVDLANNDFLGGVIDLRGRIVHRTTISTHERHGSMALEHVYQLIDGLLSNEKTKIAGIGIGTPGLINAHQGLIRKAVNLEWQNLPLRALLAERYNLPIHIANDSHAAARGEFTFGNHQKSANLIVIKVGRGLSAGIILNGRLHYGDGSGAGEIGHIRMVENGDRCRCGKTGCLETLASTHAIVAKAKTYYANNPFSKTFLPIANSTDINNEFILKAYEAGEDYVIKLIEQAGYYLGKVVANLVCVLNVQKIVIAGSLAGIGQPLLDIINCVMMDHAMTELAEETSIELSQLGQDIVLLGAASLVFKNELEIA